MAHIIQKIVSISLVSIRFHWQRQLESTMEMNCEQILWKIVPVARHPMRNYYPHFREILLRNCLRMRRKKTFNCLIITTKQTFYTDDKCNFLFSKIMIKFLLYKSTIPLLAYCPMHHFAMQNIGNDNNFLCSHVNEQVMQYKQSRN